ncbi:MAG: J domain-containing protein [Clostridiales bacterium]|nr:J domain-containing protein [Clostridiales bacterium]
MSHFIDYYLVLQVHYLASDDIIKAAYRKLCQTHHPDKGGSVDLFQKIQESYETLIDSEKKKTYLKEWMAHYIHQDSFDFGELKPSLYDITMYHVKEVLLHYLKAIQDKNYEKAYSMLSVRNKDHLFYKDFMVWQKLISEIHHLLDYDCVLESFNHGINKLVVTYKVKVKEFNMLLNQVEEDYFRREVLYENNRWCILLSDIDVRFIIRKYKKILALNKKSARLLKKYLPKIEENHFTKMVSKKYFINNCEYELLRYLRYKNSFSMIKINIKKESVSEIIEILINNETRKIDSFCKYTEQYFLVLLPESKLEHGDVVMNKIINKLPNEYIHDITYRCVEINESYKSVKNILETLTRSSS